MDHLPQLRTRIPGPKSRALARQLRRVESRNVTFVSQHWPIFWQRAAGANVWDVDGNRFVDLSAGFGVANIGHGNPRVVTALQRQAAQLLHALGDVHPHELKVKLARELSALTFGRWLGGRPDSARVFFASSGSEAVEAALKTAVLHTQRPGVIAFQGAYHGLTYGALDTTWRADFRTPFRQQLGHFTAHVPYGQVPDVKDLRNFGAVIVEPIQGRGGIVVPPDEFLPALRAFCDQHGMLLIFDEIYTGFGRTGRWFAGEHWKVVPDIVCVGKALAGGFPLSACIGRAAVMDRWPESTGEALHTSTFLGNPLGCAAALAAIGEMKRLRVDVRAEKLGGYLMARLRDVASRFLAIREVRGKGLMVGVEMTEPARTIRLVEQLLQHGVIALPEGNRNEVLGFTPPLTITKRQLDYCVDVLGGLIRKLPEGDAPSSPSSPKA